MKTLNQHCSNVHIFMFYSFGLAAAQIEILYQKISSLVSRVPTTTHKHCEKHDLILYFTFKLTNAESLICRYVDADSQRYFYKNMLQNYASNSHKRIPAGAFLINAMHSPSTAPRIPLPCFHLLNCRRILLVV